MSNSALWTTYALCVNDSYIFVCSLVGFISAALCVLLKFTLPSHDGTHPSLHIDRLARCCMSLGRRWRPAPINAGGGGLGLHHDDHEHGVSLMANAHDRESQHSDDDINGGDNNNSKGIMLLPSGLPSSSSVAFMPPPFTPWRSVVLPFLLMLLLRLSLRLLLL